MRRYLAKVKFIDLGSVLLVALAVGVPAVLAFT
jgi:hypothetical protein